LLLNAGMCGGKEVAFCWGTMMGFESPSLLIHSVALLLGVHFSK